MRVKAHKNADFVLGDDCREPSSAHWSSALPATSPAGCIWQQYARQQIAATYHATCRRACCREQHRAYRWGTTAVCFRRHACRRGTCRQDLPAAHTTVHTAVALPPRRYRKKLPSCATAEELPPCMPPGILPRDGSCAQRAGDSDVGANDKGAGDNPGDGVDAH